MISPHSMQKGVSLTEVLVALFILSIVGAVIVAGVIVAVKGNDVSRTRNHNPIVGDALTSPLYYVIMG